MDEALKSTCTYCDAEATTRDHTPPLSFFPNPPPPDLITVPSCQPCNQGFAKDDDYARMIFVAASGAQGDPDRDQIKAKVERFISRPQSKRTIASAHETIGTAWRETESGLYTRQQYFTIETLRLDSFVKRLIQALFRRQKGHKLPETHEVLPVHYSRWPQLTEEQRDFYDGMLELLLRQPRNDWGSTFDYHWVQSPNGSEQTWWLLNFYRIPHFICSTATKT